MLFMIGGYWFRNYLHLTLIISAITSGLFWSFEKNTLAQVTPDRTLPNNSRVRVYANKSIIEGGTTRNGNLFHSFKEFSLPTGSEAHFNNLTNIENIISRVTGKSISNIDGLIRANGNANLFLINPNGIIFGRNASLDIGGSFIGSTANSLKFVDGTEFSAVTPKTQPLLTISVPIGLQYGSNPGSILNQSQTENRNGEIVGLRVQPGKTLGLIGGDVTLEGSYVTANGRIEIGSVGQGSFIGLSPTDNGWELGYESVQNFQDIKFSQQAIVNANGEGGGDIQVQGRNILVADDSQIQAKTFGSKSGGNLTLNASETLEIRDGITFTDNGENGKIFNQLTTETTNYGNAGDITINTKNFMIRNKGGVFTGTSFGSKGNGGNLTINASEGVKLIGETKDDGIVSGLFALAQRNSTGNAGNISIKTNILLVQNGTQVATAASGAGNAGNLNVDAQDIQVIGSRTQSTFPTGLFASTDPNSTGNAGNLIIKTNTLTIKDGSQVAAGTFGAGKAGNLTIDAQYIRVIGRTKDDRFSSGLFTSVINSDSSTEDSSNLNIKTNTLLVRDGAQVGAATFAVGKGGNTNFINSGYTCDMYRSQRLSVCRV